MNSARGKKESVKVQEYSGQLSAIKEKYKALVKCKSKETEEEHPSVIDAEKLLKEAKAAALSWGLNELSKKLKLMPGDMPALNALDKIWKDHSSDVAVVQLVNDEVVLEV